MGKKIPIFFIYLFIYIYIYMHIVSLNVCINVYAVSTVHTGTRSIFRLYISYKLLFEFLHKQILYTKLVC